MKLLISSDKVVSDKHDWKYANTSYAHSCGVSSLAWCKKCGIEAVTGSLEPGSKCTYYKNEYLESWDGEDIIICSNVHINKAVKKIKRHMLRVLKTSNVDLIWREFQGNTQYSMQAANELINENKIKIIELDYQDIVKLIK